MPRYAYRGRDGRGGLVQGTLEGADSRAVATLLVESGTTPVVIEPARVDARAAETGDVGDFLARIFRPRVEAPELMLFSRQMHALLKAGVPIMRALAGLHDSAVNTTLRDTVKSISTSLESGRDLSSSMARQPHVFTPFYVAMVYVGESTGRLEEIFLRLFHHLEFQEFMRTQVRAALRYPSFVVAAMAGAMLVINLFVIPAFARVYKGFGADLPWMTRLLITVSDFTVAWWPWLLGAGFGALVGFTRFIRLPAGRLWWDRIRLSIPVAGKIIRKATIARFARSFALSFRSGVPITQALSLTAQTVDNAHIAGRIERMREGVERGESLLRTAVASGVFTPVALQMIVVGEESGSLDDMMEEVADLYQREVEYELKTLSAQIEPILIVGLGVLVLILALGVFLPIWDLGQAAMRK